MTRARRDTRRNLEGEAARQMVRIREARRAYRRFYASCFWYCDPAYRVTAADIPWVIEGLRKNGNREAWEVATRLSRGQELTAREDEKPDALNIVARRSQDEPSSQHDKP